MEEIKGILEILSLILALIGIVLAFVLRALFQISKEVGGFSIWISMNEKTYMSDRKDMLSRIQRLESTYIRDRRKSDMRYVFITLMLLSFSGGVVYAGDYSLSAPKAYNITTAQDWFQTDDGKDQAAFGVCYGPFYELRNTKGNQVAEFFRACGFYGQSIEAKPKEFASSALQLFSIAGLVHGAIGVNDEGKTIFGWGISLDKLWNQLPNRSKDIQLWPSDQPPAKRKLTTR